MIEMSQMAHKLQDQIQMEMQNLHQSNHQKIQSLTLDCGRYI